MESVRNVIADQILGISLNNIVVQGIPTDFMLGIAIHKKFVSNEVIIQKNFIIFQIISVHFKNLLFFQVLFIKNEILTFVNFSYSVSYSLFQNLENFVMLTYIVFNTPS